jgi:hypothetical protein
VSIESRANNTVRAINSGEDLYKGVNLLLVVMGEYKFYTKSGG